jgi:hypothetical protein
MIATTRLSENSAWRDPRRTRDPEGVEAVRTTTIWSIATR